MDRNVVSALKVAATRLFRVLTANTNLLSSQDSVHPESLCPFILYLPTTHRYRTWKSTWTEIYVVARDIVLFGTRRGLSVTMGKNWLLRAHAVISVPIVHQRRMVVASHRRHRPLPPRTFVNRHRPIK